MAFRDDQCVPWRYRKGVRDGDGVGVLFKDSSRW
jgi:hypothetical protein